MKRMCQVNGKHKRCQQYFKKVAASTMQKKTRKMSVSSIDHCACHSYKRKREATYYTKTFSGLRSQTGVQIVLLVCVRACVRVCVCACVRAYSCVCNFKLQIFDSHDKEVHRKYEEQTEVISSQPLPNYTRSKRSQRWLSED